MYNYTNGSDIWAHRLQGFLNRTSFFFPANKGGVMVEICEDYSRCNIDQWSFKAYLARWLALSAQLAPFTSVQIMPLLQHSAQAAARQCDAGPNQNMCGSRWNNQTADGNFGVGQQMSALSIIQSTLALDVKPPYSADTGGTSKGNPAAGTGSEAPSTAQFDPITTGSKAGAGILTALVLVSMMGGGWWLVV
jgi:hypothetical protein